MKIGWVRWLVILPLVLFATAATAWAEGEKEVRAFWADAFAAGLKTRAEIDQLVARVQEANANTIIAQVRRRGDSFYINSAEPFTEDTTVEAGLDPLAYLLERAHAAGLEVHAWVAVNTIYSGHPFIATAAWPCMVPCSPDHVFNTHGFFVTGDDNWLTQTHPNFTAGTVRYPATGTPLIPLGWRLSDGNWWMDPGHPAAADYTVNVIKHLVANYAIDGLHLDRIRYPEMPIARPTPTGPIGFATGYNPVSVRRFNAAFGRAEGTLPDPWDADWSQWRRDQMNQLVRRLYLEIVHVKPKMKVSASTIAFWRGPGQLGGFQNTEAYSRVYQDWDGWLRDGFLDLNVPMIYKPVPSAENAAAVHRLDAVRGRQSVRTPDGHRPRRLSERVRGFARAARREPPARPVERRARRRPVALQLCDDEQGDVGRAASAARGILPRAVGGWRVYAGSAVRRSGRHPGDALEEASAARVAPGAGDRHGRRAGGWREHHDQADHRLAGSGADRADGGRQRLQRRDGAAARAVSVDHHDA